MPFFESFLRKTGIILKGMTFKKFQANPEKGNELFPRIRFSVKLL